MVKIAAAYFILEPVYSNHFEFRRGPPSPAATRRPLPKGEAKYTFSLGEGGPKGRMRVLWYTTGVSVGADLVSAPSGTKHKFKMGRVLWLRLLQRTLYSNQYTRTILNLGEARPHPPLRVGLSQRERQNIPSPWEKVARRAG